METITLTFEHTSIEDSMLLVNGGIPADTADMMWLFEGDEPRATLGYFKVNATTYPDLFKPCWSEHKLRSMIADLGYKGGIIYNTNALVPTLLSLWTMKELREKKENT